MTNKISHQRQAALVNATKARQGSVAIFTEHPECICVRVEKVDTDDWGVSLTLAVVDVPGFSMKPATKARGFLTVGIAWEHGSFKDDWWKAHYVVWNLYFNDELVERALAMAKENAAQGQNLGIFVFQQLRSEHERNNRAR